MSQQELPYTALLRLEDLQLNLDAFKIDLRHPTTRRTLVRIVQSVTATIEGSRGTNRRLIVRKVTFSSLRWTEADHPDYRFKATLSQWPLVQVVSPVDTDILAEGRFVYADSALSSLTAFVGYRRHDQTLTLLQQALPDLTTLPDELPGDLAESALELALFRYRKREVGIGRTRVVEMMGGNQVQIEGLSMNTEKDILRTIRGHRAWA